ncbi:hypothetical protein K8O68_09435 [Salipaludibacillus sp. CUR1]|uniref:hypothetical protein n=1 Tax=Salipaludibacillus sp. CUR1 TaxID=2820003 RepID=UPI001E286BA0|nr:hypothetical protein [Salipaludibacillus sp. CUR1]MCE7792636.1 hypothetical protein [Salipaludibacillus sp. CUR1]
MNEKRLNHLQAHLNMLSNIYATSMHHYKSEANKVHTITEIIRTIRAIEHELGINQQRNNPED